MEHQNKSVDFLGNLQLTVHSRCSGEKKWIKKVFTGDLRNPGSFIGKHAVISRNCLVVEAKEEKKKQKSTNVSGEHCVGDKRGKIIVLPSTLDTWISNQG